MERITGEEIKRGMEHEDKNSPYLGLIPIICPLDGCENCNAGTRAGVCTRTLKAMLLSEYEKVDTLSSSLLEERKQPKVWDNAPEWAAISMIHFYDGKENSYYSIPYTRDLPKSPEREIAESEASKQIVMEGLIYIPKDKLADAIEAGINRFRALKALNDSRDEIIATPPRPRK
jgi:hypothetical protein